jgi:hypothetical protein
MRRRRDHRVRLDDDAEPATTVREHQQQPEDFTRRLTEILDDTER